MSIDQVESAILGLTPAERYRLLRWLDEHRQELFSLETEREELTAEQEAEILRRRQEYQEHPQRFKRMDEQALDEMFARIRGHVAARLSSLG
jgi:hypothetical protein